MQATALRSFRPTRPPAAPYLDYTDTVLGQVYEGMDVVDTIAQAAVDENQKPTETIAINSVSIETYQAQ